MNKAHHFDYISLLPKAFLVNFDEVIWILTNSTGKGIDVVNLNYPGLLV